MINRDADATALSFTIILDTNTVLVGGSEKVTPLAVNDDYTLSRTATIDGTDIVIDATNGLLLNDLGGAGTTIASCAGETCTVTAVNETGTLGDVTSFTGAGSFTYEPPAGFSGTDTFAYTLTDADGLTDTGVVSINIADGAWYVDNSNACDGTGTLGDPFCVITALDIAGGLADTAAPNILFDDGCTISDLVSDALAMGGEDAVEDLLEDLTDQGILSEDEAEAIEECAEEEEEDD